MANLDSDLVVYFCVQRSPRWWWKRHEVYLYIENRGALMKRFWWWDKADDHAAWLNDFFECELLPVGDGLA